MYNIRTKSVNKKITRFSFLGGLKREKTHARVRSRIVRRVRDGGNQSDDCSAIRSDDCARRVFFFSSVPREIRTSRASLCACTMTSLMNPRARASSPGRHRRLCRASKNENNEKKSVIDAYTTAYTASPATFVRVRSGTVFVRRSLCPREIVTFLSRKHSPRSDRKRFFFPPVRTTVRAGSRERR